MNSTAKPNRPVKNDGQVKIPEVMFNQGAGVMKRTNGYTRAAL